MLLYFLRHEGRGIGLAQKIRAYDLQEYGLDTAEANQALGLPVDGRDYSLAVPVLTYFGIRKVRLATNNPAKVRALQDRGIEVERVPLNGFVNERNADYLRVKDREMGHLDSFGELIDRADPLRPGRH